jgi:tRNA 2-selenouridine synthase
MAIKIIGVEELQTFSKNSILILDVRSPSEYAHAHLPEAINLPLFTDDERKIVGTAYKQVSKQKAIKIGLDFYGPKMRQMVEEVEALLRLPLNSPTPEAPKKVLVHCWRGGMRSGGVAWLLDLYGFEVYQLAGGYKAYRNWVLSQFEKPYLFHIIGGNTGSAKTPLLKAIGEKGKQMIDLEALAIHKGSALGGIGQDPQPSQEMFENKLAEILSIQNLSKVIFLEDESQRIGRINIPASIWKKMLESDLSYFEIPFEERLRYLVATYGELPLNELHQAILRIQKRLGGLETKNTLQFLAEGQLSACFGILLRYYDKWYKKGLESKEKGSVMKIESPTVEITHNLQLLFENLPHF